MSMVAQYIDRSRYTSDRSRHTSDRPRYTSDRTRYTSDRSRYTSDRSQYTSDRSRYVSDRSRHGVCSPRVLAPTAYNLYNLYNFELVLQLVLLCSMPPSYPLHPSSSRSLTLHPLPTYYLLFTPYPYSIHENTHTYPYTYPH